jgi:hypothetical protein
MVLHQNILIKIILSVNKDEFQWRKCLFDFHLALTKANDCILPPSLAKAAESRVYILKDETMLHLLSPFFKKRINIETVTR